MKSNQHFHNCEKRSQQTENCLKVCLTNSLQQFELSSKIKVEKEFNMTIVRLETPSSKDIHQITNVANCRNGDGKRGKQEDQKFLAKGGILVAIYVYSKANIDHSHRDSHHCDDDRAPDWVPLVDEGHAVVNIGANIIQEQPKVWLIEGIRRRNIKIRTHQR